MLRFQATGLYEYCVEQFGEVLKVSNVVEMLVQAHDSGLAELEAAAMGSLKANALTFQVGMCVLTTAVVAVLCCRSLSKLIGYVKGEVRLLFSSACPDVRACVCVWLRTAAGRHGNNCRVAATARSHGSFS